VTERLSTQLRYWNISLDAGDKVRLVPVVSINDEGIVTDSNGRDTIVIGAHGSHPDNVTPESGSARQARSASISPAHRMALKR